MKVFVYDVTLQKQAGTTFEITLHDDTKRKLKHKILNSWRRPFRPNHRYVLRHYETLKRLPSLNPIRNPNHRSPTNQNRLTNRNIIAGSVQNINQNKTAGFMHDTPLSRRVLYKWFSDPRVGGAWISFSSVYKVRADPKQMAPLYVAIFEVREKSLVRCNRGCVIKILKRLSTNIVGIPGQNDLEHASSKKFKDNPADALGYRRIAYDCPLRLFSPKITRRLYWRSTKEEISALLEPGTRIDQNGNVIPSPSIEEMNRNNVRIIKCTGSLTLPFSAVYT
jgi:hypothetical protein